MKRTVRIPLIGIGLLGFCSLALFAAGVNWFDDARENPARALRQLAGGHARIVWVEQAEGDNTDVGAKGAQLRLMGLDTDDRRGIRPILPMIGRYHKPMITPRGDQIVFTDWAARNIRVVNWAGTSVRDLARGLAVALWTDPADGTDWVYAFGSTNINLETDAEKPLVRFRLDNPTRQETVWDVTDLTPDNIQISQDGTRMGALFPWPRAGVVDVKTKDGRELGRGCWPSLARDNSYLLWIFDGAHRNVNIRSADGQLAWSANINSAPGIDGYEVYHPRWSNHPRFLCMTGPYRGGEGSNQIGAGGPGVDIYAGRFDATLRSVEQWVRVTHNARLDVYPDVWIDPAVSWPITAAGTGTNTTPAGSATGAVERLTVQATLLEITATPTLESIAPYRQALVVHAYQVDRVLSGQYQPPRVLVAHWAIMNGKAKPTDKRKGRPYTLTLEPFANHKELEGERVIMSVKEFRYPLYLDMEKR